MGNEKMEDSSSAGYQTRSDKKLERTGRCHSWCRHPFRREVVELPGKEKLPEWVGPDVSRWQRQLF